MKLRLAARGIELSADLNDYIRRRAHFSLGRFAARIRSMSVSLAGANGPRGGIDKICHIRVDVGLRQQVIVRELQGTIHAAIAFAVGARRCAATQVEEHEHSGGRSHA